MIPPTPNSGPGARFSQPRWLEGCSGSWAAKRRRQISKLASLPNLAMRQGPKFPRVKIINPAKHCFVTVFLLAFKLVGRFKRDSGETVWGRWFEGDGPVPSEGGTAKLENALMRGAVLPHLLVDEHIGDRHAARALVRRVGSIGEVTANALKIDGCEFRAQVFRTRCVVGAGLYLGPRRDILGHLPIERGENIAEIGGAVSFPLRHIRDGPPYTPGSIGI